MTLISLRFGPARIKRIRSSLGLTQTQLADRLGVSQQAVSAWETDQWLPQSPDLLSALLRAEMDGDKINSSTPAGSISPAGDQIPHKRAECPPLLRPLNPNKEDK